MDFKKISVTSGVRDLDRLLGGGIYIGDNVVWYDDVGSLASAFSLNLILASRKQKKSLIYVSFDRSPKNLIEKIGTLANTPNMTILDCFTHGKGKSSEIFLTFYKQNKTSLPCPIIEVKEPQDPDSVSESFYELHKTMKEDVRFIFESLTGMQELWGKEDDILKFYSHSCPRLYELNTIAYWIVEKDAHSSKLKAHINKITQVAIDLSLKRGKTFLAVLKAEKRDMDILNKPVGYWNKDLKISFHPEKRSTGRIDLGVRLKALRSKRGLSQTELAKLIGVTPSTISQIENNQIYPSLPALIKISEVLSVELNSFFVDADKKTGKIVFPSSESIDYSFPNLPKDSITSKSFLPHGFPSQAVPYVIKVPPGKILPSHFFLHKGEEMGYVLSGALTFITDNGVHSAEKGDVIYLSSEMPSRWENKGKHAASVLWIKLVDKATLS